MKSRTKIVAIATSLTIILSYIAVGLYASEKYENSIDPYSQISKYKVQKKNKKQIKLALLESPEVIEENHFFEDWMFDSKFISVQFEQENKIEPWMLDRSFWIINKPFDLNEELIEEPSEIEHWMINFCPMRCSSSGFYTNFLEKEWMKMQTSCIL